MTITNWILRAVHALLAEPAATAITSMREVADERYESAINAAHDANTKAYADIKTMAHTEVARLEDLAAHVKDRIDNLIDAAGGGVMSPDHETRARVLASRVGR